ncbi:3-deoxy-D-manno-octulosonic acid transferase [Galbibacter pacificus]|uniref:3-deoxy-D-manno-octulosonic acid transferase n=1 Tax=Galbibacter pacificus TaxID=2996052 RepID=A0ABT6FTB9_9FLAO|nr:glycosyltransferase N-terminal domain-containing protein [Galbibacter pacificus]MDG3583014.1 glycosyltransferase N-terminal domain-containing protein [Galbibacter pacificus]MDG3586495.1 3-deoxy-D-manno-octulosonic acid transferase [Galbibacter pacificus]
MLFLYNILVYITGFFLKIAALFNDKLKLFVEGRKIVFDVLTKNIRADDKVIWFHIASLGEFEQGLPLIEQAKKGFPDHKILVTFFSPSGYEVKKNTPVAHVVCYLPLDTASNATRFLEAVRPRLAIFVKYEFWPNYLSALKRKSIPTLLVSGIFRENQAFFHWYGSFMRKSLQTFNHFFVQNESSKLLLEHIGFGNTTVSGDTRFDRVEEILHRDNTLKFLEGFVGDNLCFVAGSTWPEDEKLIVDYINKDIKKNIKYIIAPHTVQPSSIQKLRENIHKKTVLYSEKEEKNISDYDVFIVDTIGILTKIYSYATIAYVGGGMGSTGLHNTLEPAVFGIPVIIGKNYKGFVEAEQLVALGGILSVSTKGEFSSTLNHLLENQSDLYDAGQKNKAFINKNKGAKIQIGYYIRKLLE